MKLDFNPLDIKPTGELTLYGDARTPLEEIRKNDLVVINGSPYRVLDITDDGNSAMYQLESASLEDWQVGMPPETGDEDVAQYRGVVSIEWPAPTRPGPYGAMLGRGVTVSDAVTGKPITTCTGITVRAHSEGLVTADLILYADEDGEPLLDGKPVLDGKDIKTGTFPFLVSEMRVRKPEHVPGQAVTVHVNAAGSSEKVAEHLGRALLDEVRRRGGEPDRM